MFYTLPEAAKTNLPHMGRAFTDLQEKRQAWWDQ